MEKYDLTDYEEKLFHINDTLRTTKVYKNPVQGPFLGETYDGSGETLILHQYLQYNRNFFYDYKMFNRIYQLSNELTKEIMTREEFQNAIKQKQEPNKKKFSVKNLKRQNPTKNESDSCAD